MRAVFSPPSHIAKSDEAGALEEYADALRGFDAKDLQAGWQEVRNAHARAWWPPVGALVRACADAKKRRVASIPSHDKIYGRYLNGKIEPWGGACECDRCVKKLPSDGFYRASSEDHRLAALERRELDEFFTARTAIAAQ